MIRGGHALCKRKSTIRCPFLGLTVHALCKRKSTILCPFLVGPAGKTGNGTKTSRMHRIIRPFLHLVYGRIPDMAGRIYSWQKTRYQAAWSYKNKRPETYNYWKTIENKRRFCGEYKDVVSKNNLFIGE